MIFKRGFTHFSNERWAFYNRKYFHLAFRSLDLNDKGEGINFLYIYISGFLALKCKCTDIVRRVECILNVVNNEFFPKRFNRSLNDFFLLKRFILYIHGVN